MKTTLREIEKNVSGKQIVLQVNISCSAPLYSYCPNAPTHFESDCMLSCLCCVQDREVQKWNEVYIWIFHIFHCSVHFHCSTDRMRCVSVCIHLQYLPICSSDKRLLLINVASFNYSANKAVCMHIIFAHFYDKKHSFLKNLIQLSLSITYISHCVRKYFRLSFHFASSQYQDFHPPLPAFVRFILTNQRCRRGL